MTFEFYGFEPGPTGSEASKALMLLFPTPDADQMACNFPRHTAMQEVEAIFRKLIADPNNRELSIVVVSPTMGGNIVAVEYPNPIPPQITERHGRESHWLKWIVDPVADMPEAAPRTAGR